MIKPYLLTIEFIIEFYGYEKSAAYDLIIKVRKSKSDNKDYKPTLYDLCKYEGWDFSQFMFFVLATREEAVELFGNNITSGTRTITLDGKYGDNAVLVIPEQKIPEIIIDQFEITKEGIRPTLPIIVSPAKEKVQTKKKEPEIAKAANKISKPTPPNKAKDLFTELDKDFESVKPKPIIKLSKIKKGDK